MDATDAGSRPNAGTGVYMRDAAGTTTTQATHAGLPIGVEAHITHHRHGALTHHEGRAILTALARGALGPEFAGPRRCDRESGIVGNRDL